MKVLGMRFHTCKGLMSKGLSCATEKSLSASDL